MNPDGLTLSPGGAHSGATRPAERRPTGPAEHGMTLIELIVTLILLAVLVLAVMPGIGAWMRNGEIRNAAQGMVNALNKARAEAVRRNQDVWFSLVSARSDNPGLLDDSCALSTSSASWVLSLDTPEGQCSPLPSETTAPRILEKHAQGDGSPGAVVTVRGADCTGSASATQVVFNSFGRAAAPSGAPALRCLDIAHRSSGDQRPLRVLVGSTGSVRLCDPAVSDTTDPRHC